jgi:hypothetical protein
MQTPHGTTLQHKEMDIADKTKHLRQYTMALSHQTYTLAPVMAAGVVLRPTPGALGHMAAAAMPILVKPEAKEAAVHTHLALTGLLHTV